MWRSVGDCGSYFGAEKLTILKMSCKNKISVLANGKSFLLPYEHTLSAFLKELGLSCGLVVVEHNGKAIVPSRMDGVVLSNGDRLEIVRIAAGG